MHDENFGFVPLEITGAPEDVQVFLDNGDFDGLVKHLQEKGELPKAKVYKKVKRSKKSK